MSVFIKYATSQSLFTGCSICTTPGKPLSTHWKSMEFNAINVKKEYRSGYCICKLYLWTLVRFCMFQNCFKASFGHMSSLRNK